MSTKLDPNAPHPEDHYSYERNALDTPESRKAAADTYVNAMAQHEASRLHHEEVARIANTSRERERLRNTERALGKRRRG